MRMSAPIEYTAHALERFIERWGPMHDPEDALHMAVCTRATHVENIPEEKQSIWGFVVLDGPRKGETALMVVSADGTVRTVLPSGSRRPEQRRRRKGPAGHHSKRTLRTRGRQ